MAVTLIELSAELRIGDGVTAPDEPIAGILTRLSSVADAFIELQAPDAPEAIKDEAKIRLVANLYDSPPASAGDRNANAWANSGAGSLVGRWVQRRAEPDSE